MAINEDNVLVSGSDNGKLHFWDWKSGHNFHTSETIAQARPRVAARTT